MRTTAIDTSSETRAPKISRLRTSRPRSSVPRMWSRDPPANHGGCRLLARSGVSGSYGASSPENTPQITNTTRMAPEKYGQRASRRRLRRGRIVCSGGSTWGSMEPIPDFSSACSGNATGGPPHSWVEHPVGQVDDQQESDEQQRVDEHDALHDGVVAGVDPLDRQLAHAGPGEQGLD